MISVAVMCQENVLVFMNHILFYSICMLTFFCMSTPHTHIFTPKILIIVMQQIITLLNCTLYKRFQRQQQKEMFLRMRVFVALT